jgi:hypothetical protein
MPHTFRIGSVLLAATVLPGCLIVDVGVTNPVRGLSTVAVVPFFNQSDERMVNGRLLASQYASELQKTPGLEVIPVGVVETTMRQYGLQDISSPADAARLALLLKADAVVIGTVTEYSPYYPPRIGLSVAWYSPHRHTFDPAVPVDPKARKNVHDNLKARRKAEAKARREERRLRKLLKRGEIIGKPGNETFDSSATTIPVIPESGLPDRSGTPGSKPFNLAPDPLLSDPDDSRFRPPIIIRGQSGTMDGRGRREVVSRTASGGVAISGAMPLRIPPLMTYTKVFDASDAATLAAFRDYLELRDDGRDVKWTARLEWADDFSRFVCHMMIVEMFQLHGGEGRRRVVLKMRKYK